MKFEPFGVGCLENEEVASFAWIVGTVHVGVEENAEVCWELELVECENVVVIDRGGFRILEEGAQVIAGAGEVCRIWWGV